MTDQTSPRTSMLSEPSSPPAEAGVSDANAPAHSPEMPDKALDDESADDMYEDTCADPWWM